MILVDPQDQHLLAEHYWSINQNGNTFYAKAKINGADVALHRRIMDAPQGMDVDHINGNGLDNRRANLRLATRQQNNANSGPRKGQYKGVSWSKARSKWRAQIQDGKKRSLGSFDTAEEAAAAYNVAALEAWGEFAYVNELVTQ